MEKIDNALVTPTSGKIENIEEEYVRIGTTLFRIINQPMMNGSFRKMRVEWKMSVFRLDHGKDEAALIPKYDGFCTMPSHTDYQLNVNNFYNLYEPITHIPKEGEFNHIQSLIEHIFGEQYKLGMDYLQLLYLKPTQKLPILLLVSEERNTGKSTFLNFLKALFQENVTFNTNEDFRSQFNADWAGKLMIVVDEVLLNRREDSERLKNLSTAHSYKMEAKGKDRYEVQFFAKFVLCSNNENFPVYIEPEETRYWVRKISRLGKDDTSFLQKLQDEIPAFLYHLQHRNLTTKEENRMWFSPSLIRTEALEKIIRCNRSRIELDMAELLLDIMDTGKSSVSCPPKTKRFCPLKTFNNAPLKSLDRWGYYYFSLFPSVCSHFTDTFSCQLNPVRRMYNTIHNGICYCRVSDCIIPIVRWQLRGDDDGLAPMSVLYYIEQDGSFLGIKVHKEEVIQYEQRAPFDSLEFRFQCAFYFCHLKRTHKFRSIRIICPYALLAGFIPHCCGKEALPGTG